MLDDEIIVKAFAEDWILITNDRILVIRSIASDIRTRV